MPLESGTLLGTSGTLDGIKQVIEQFYCGEKFDVLDTGELQRVSDGKIIETAVVRKKGKRYRFEVK